MNKYLQIQETEEVSAGVEESEFAEPNETVNEGINETEVEASEAETKPEVDMNAIYANARRKAEAEAKEKYDCERQKLDAEYVRMFGDKKNPLTGQPIRSANDYALAFQAQEQMRAQQELQSKGIDPEFINRIVENNPAVKQANELIKAQEQQTTMKSINDDIAELGTLNPSIKSLDDVPREVIEKCMQIRGLRLTDAYKMLNYGNFTSEREAAVRQNAINQAKGKQHLQPVNGVSVTEGGVDIPDDELATWKRAYPDLSASELRKKYNRVIGT